MSRIQETWARERQESFLVQRSLMMLMNMFVTVASDDKTPQLPDVPDAWYLRTQAPADTTQPTRRHGQDCASNRPPPAETGGCTRVFFLFRLTVILTRWLLSGKGPQ